MTTTPFGSWDDQVFEACRILAEASGWAVTIEDPDDDAELLAWARHYLPRVREYAARAFGE